MNYLRKTVISVFLGFTLLSLTSCQSKTHVVSWLNDDGTVIEIDEVPNGVTPVYSGKTPTKPASEQYEYIFSGWSEKPSPAYADVSYIATYTEGKREYKITWLNYDGSLIKTSSVPYGEYPHYAGDVPYRKGSESELYTFSGWNPAVQAVTGDAIYTASFESSTRQYSITWKNYDGSTLKTSLFDYGSKPTYDGEIPTKPSDSCNDYYFSSWYPSITNETIVTKNFTYTALFSSTIKTATIKWINEDGTLLKEDKDVPYGTYPFYGATAPIKQSDNKHTYKFAGWDPSLSSVMGDITYKATFKEEIKTYEISWLNYDGSLLFQNAVAYGEVPAYRGATPYHPADAEYTYNFAGWDKEISPVYGATTYKAKFTATERKYTVKWVDYNGTVLEIDENVPYGDTPSYDGVNPTRQSDSQYSYTFSGWEPTIGTVAGDITYRATYSKQESLKKYTVTWLNYDGKVLAIDHLSFASVPVYNGDEPTKEGDLQYSYVFDGWDKNPSPIKGDVTYVAKFKETIKKYTIKWVDSDGKLLKSEQIEYGKMPSYSETMPKKEDDDYRYTFSSWSPNRTEVKGDQTYTAEYRKDRLYTISFYNYDGSLLSTQKAIYGETPYYSGVTPTKPSSLTYSYEFDGWSPAITSVTGSKSYRATFREIPRKYKVTWRDYDGRFLASEEYSYNATPNYKKENPTRSADSQYKYIFSGWSPNISKVIKDVTYMAQYNKMLYRALVSFDLQGGSTPDNKNSRYSDLSDGKDLFYNVTKPGYAFMGWSYNGTKLFDERGNKLVETIELNEKMTLRAEFGKSHSFVVQNQSTVGGSLSGSGNYACGQTVTAIATPQKGYQFDGWRLNGTLVSTTERYSFEMPDNDYTLTGSFSLKSYKLTLKASSYYGKIALKVNGATLSYTSSDTYVKYTYTVEVTAVSNSSSYVFLGWYDTDGNRVSDLPVYTFSMPYNDYELTAKWRE